jgi:hypothetical protein
MSQYSLRKNRKTKQSITNREIKVQIKNLPKNKIPDQMVSR